jgi:hypothetical protein
MAVSLKKVRPGDLITADDWNKIIDAYDALDTRIKSLETGVVVGGNLQILGLSPSRPMRMGEELRVVGKNFGVVALNVATIESAVIDQFKLGSNSNILIFDIPAVPGVPASGKLVTLSVSGPTGFDSTTFTLLPAQANVPDGQLIINLSQSPANASPPQDIQAGSSYTFVFSVRAITNMQETYTVTPAIVGESGWGAVYVNSAGLPISPSEITIPQGAPPNGITRDIHIRVDVPAGASGAALRLSVTSKRNPTKLTKTTGNIDLTVGSAPPSGSDDIVFTLDSVSSPASIDPISGTVVVPAGQPLVAVNFIARIKSAGRYTAQNPTIGTDPSNRWTAILAMSDPNFTTNNDNADVTIQLGLAAQAGAPNTNLGLQVVSAADASITGSISQPIRVG